MQKIILFFGSVIIFAYTITFNQIYEINAQAYRKLGFAVKHASHDGALMINDLELAQNGKIIFEQEKVLETVKKSLKNNLPLDENLVPLHGFWYKEPLKIVDIIYIDNSYIDPLTNSEVAFPYIYNYKNIHDGKIYQRAVFGPSIVLIVEANLWKMEEPTREIVIQEYKY